MQVRPVTSWIIYIAKTNEKWLQVDALRNREIGRHQRVSHEKVRLETLRPVAICFANFEI